jgi:hypothetical protein
LPILFTVGSLLPLCLCDVEEHVRADLEVAYTASRLRGALG